MGFTPQKQGRVRAVVQLDSHADYDGHEKLLSPTTYQAGSRLSWLFTAQSWGPAFGGCRMYPYVEEGQAIADVLRLSKGMTYKTASAACLMAVANR